MASNLAQLDAVTNDLINSLQTLRSHGSSAHAIEDIPFIDIDRVRRHASVLQTLLGEPAYYLQQLAVHNQRLACLHWLCETQLFACIPLDGSVAMREVADLASVPEKQLIQVIRLMATDGFFWEPQPGHVAHTAVSAPFFTKPTLVDAATFIAETLAPAALQMLQMPAAGEQPPVPMGMRFNSAPRLERQWLAYLRHIVNEEPTSKTDVLLLFNWSGLDTALVVESCAQSDTSAMALLQLKPGMRYVVQLQETDEDESSQAHKTPWTKTGLMGPQGCEHLDSRIVIQHRKIGVQQHIGNAAVYIIRIPWPLAFGALSVREQLVKELKAHISVLRSNPNARLLITASLVPEPGAVEPRVEEIARFHNLALWRLANEATLDASAIVEVVSSVADCGGRLVVVNKATSRTDSLVLFEVEYAMS